MNKFCAQCGTNTSEMDIFCSKCGTNLKKSAGVQSFANKQSGIFNKQNSTQIVDTGPVTSKIFINILSIALGVGLVIGIALHAHSNRLISETETLVNNSEYYVFTNKEVLDFWNKNLSTQFSQEDRFIGSLFPSISEDAEIYSAPYLQLLVYPTAESLESDRTNFESDVNSLGNGWVACSNVALVFPLSRLNEMNKINEVFCE